MSLRLTATPRQPRHPLDPSEQGDPLPPKDQVVAGPVGLLMLKIQISWPVQPEVTYRNGKPYSKPQALLSRFWIAHVLDASFLVEGSAFKTSSRSWILSSASVRSLTTTNWDLQGPSTGGFNGSTPFVASPFRWLMLRIQRKAVWEEEFLLGTSVSPVPEIH